MNKYLYSLLVFFLCAPSIYAQSNTVINQEALLELKEAAEMSGSDAVVVLYNEELIADWYFDKAKHPIEIMSVLKSIVSLGIGKLLTDGKLDSLDQPIYTIYPEWRQGKKKEITIRHLMNHTSGLQNLPNAGAEIYPSPNAIKLALAAEIESDPGATFSYNNKAVNLLSGIIEKVYGLSMDQFFITEFFKPMGIEEYQWFYDEEGNPHAMAGLRLHSKDFAKFGQLVLNKGMWEEQPLVGEEYLEIMLSQSQPYQSNSGLLWWRLIDEDDNAIAYYGDGYLGQTLMVIPEYNIVAVRQVSQNENYNRETDGFRAFKTMVLALVKD